MIGLLNFIVLTRHVTPLTGKRKVECDSVSILQPKLNRPLAARRGLLLETNAVISPIPLRCELFLTEVIRLAARSSD